MKGRDVSNAMSVVLLIRSLNYGGAERQLIALARGLHARGHSVLVATFYDEGPLHVELRQAGVQVATLRKRGRWDVLGFLWRLWRLIASARPDVLYSFLVEPSVLAVLLKPLLPRTRIVWGVRASNVALELYGWFPRFTFRLSRLLAGRADLIIANSRAGAAYHRAQGYPGSRIAVVPNGIDFEQFRPNPEAGRRARVAWRLPAHSALVGVVGRLDPMKDHTTFLDAVAALLKKHPDVLVVCVGGGPDAYRSQLETRAAELGVSHRVIWLGPQADMPTVYNSFDVCCLPSAFGEGFSNALGEAMACGVPCVATDVGDAAQILNGCGVLVPPRDARRLAAGLEDALAAANPDRKRACREHIERTFSLDRMVDDTERLLRGLIPIQLHASA